MPQKSIHPLSIEAIHSTINTLGDVEKTQKKYPSSVNRGYSLHPQKSRFEFAGVVCIHPLSIEAIHATRTEQFPLARWCRIHPLSIEAIHST